MLYRQAHKHWCRYILFTVYVLCLTVKSQGHYSPYNSMLLLFIVQYEVLAITGCCHDHLTDLPHNLAKRIQVTSYN